MSNLISKDTIKEWLNSIGVYGYDWQIDKLPSAKPWIPCKERLPEGARRTYWVCTDEGNQMECRWTNANNFFPNLTTDWHWNIFDIPQYQKVIAWMSLPEPYKEVE